jgi:plastocyanin
MTRLSIIAALAALPAALTAQAAPAAPAAPPAKPVDVTLSEWKVELASDTLTAGPVTFRITNNGGMNHALYVMGGTVAQGTKEIAARQSATLRVTLKPGEYELYCPMSDQSHKMAGMTRRIVVVDRAAGKTP